MKKHLTKIFGSKSAAIIAGLLASASLAGVALASHSWGPPYHWARSANPLALNVGDNVSSGWDAYLDGAIADWNPSTVLELTEVVGQGLKNCRPTAGRIEVCNKKYGSNGWLGLAQIWITGGEHIYQGTAKVNDTYFSRAFYNTPPWKRMVMCQEIAHDFGLDHQDENQNNANLGSCMDYTNDPDGPPSNEHPNAHDFAQLELIYNSHLDASTTIASANGKNAASEEGSENPSEWGKVIKRDSKGKPSHFERDLGGGKKVVTFVIWAE